MRAWLRLVLVTETVGGGFCGVAMFAKMTFDDHSLWPISSVAIAIYTFIVISGLALVHDPQRTRPLFVALALQIPWISSPVITYQIYSGSGAGVAVIGGNLTREVVWVGSQTELRLFQDVPWGIGINLVPVVLLLLLWRSVKVPKPTLQPPAPLPDPVNQAGGQEHENEVASGPR